MKTKKTLPYYLKCALPILGFAGATLLTSCEKETEPTRDIELEIPVADAAKPTIEEVTMAASQPDVRYVYLVPSGVWTHWHSLSVHNFRKLQLEPKLNVSKKVRGRGNFDFMIGEPSQVPEDSLWYVQNGWTINAHLTRGKQR